MADWQCSAVICADCGRHFVDHGLSKDFEKLKRVVTDVVLDLFSFSQCLMSTMFDGHNV